MEDYVLEKWREIVSLVMVLGECYFMAKKSEILTPKVIVLLTWNTVLQLGCFRRAPRPAHKC